MRGYPQTLHEQAELAPQLQSGEPPTPGADDLRKSLFTLPTHSYVKGVDFVALHSWMHDVIRDSQSSVAGASAIRGREALSHMST